MAQHDFDIANQNFPSTRSDFNAVLAAIQSTSSGANYPTPAVKWQIAVKVDTPKTGDGTFAVCLDATEGTWLPFMVYHAATDTVAEYWSFSQDVFLVANLLSEVTDTNDQATLRGNIGAASAADAAALRDIVANAQTSSYTLALTDAAKSIDTIADVTVPLNSSVAFPIGTTISITNTGTGTISIVQTSGVTLRLAGTATTGTRALLPYGVATLRQYATNVWIIMGAGLS